MDWYQDILDFHKAAELHIEDKPTIPPADISKLRWSLIEEEIEETREAIFQGNLIEIADGIVDSIVVLLGTAVSYGIDIRPIWNEVHKTNMAKVGGRRREDGKLLKPAGWTPPDVEGELRKQGWS